MKSGWCFFVLAVIVCLPVGAGADSGAVLQEYKSYRERIFPGPTSTNLAPGSQDETAIDIPGTMAEGQVVYLQKFHVVGNTILSDRKLFEVLAPYVDRPLSGQDILQAANVLRQAIRKEGAFLAKVYILPQDIGEGTITFNVIEGRLARDGITLGRSSARVKDEIILKTLDYTLRPGTVITAGKYERAILLVNDLPGIKNTENLIFPAENVGEARFETIPEDDKLVRGELFYDNFGGYFTGRHRFGTVAQFNSPARRAGKLILGANVSELGTAYGYGDASILLHPSGLRGGVGVDYLYYRTDEPDNLRGPGLDASLYFTYPFIRSLRHNLYGEVRYTFTHLVDETDFSKLTDRMLHVGSLILHGDSHDTLLGGGVTTAQVGFYAGVVNLGNIKPFEEFDADHAQTQGGFFRFVYSLSRLQHLIGNLQTYVSFNGQLASKRLDPSQSIFFGGPYSFPGYNVGEIFGDDGWMVHFDVRYTFTSPPWQGNLQVAPFFDYGWIKSHTVAVIQGFAVPGAVDRSYFVKCAGLRINQDWQKFSLMGIVGWQIDNEIPKEVLDDNGKNNIQGWVQVVYRF